MSSCTCYTKNAPEMGAHAHDVISIWTRGTPDGGGVEKRTLTPHKIKPVVFRKGQT